MRRFSCRALHVERATLIVLLALAIGSCLGNAGVPPGTCEVFRVTVSPTSTQIVPGTTTPLEAVVISTNCGVLPTNWWSSAPNVAKVDGNGVVTAVAPGTVIITASTADTGLTGGKSGTAVVFVQPGATLMATVTPAAGATNVGIDSPVTIRFSAPVDTSTVNAGTIVVSTGSSAIGGTRAVAGNVVTFTPTQPLREFNTTYTVTVAGVLSTRGNFLDGPQVSTFTTVFWDPAYSYRLTNAFDGDATSLDTSPGSLECIMVASAATAGQSWYFIPVPQQAGYYTVHNLLGADSVSLQSDASPTRCRLSALAPGAATSVQLWKPVVFGPLSPGGYRLQNLALGDAQSLDALLVSGDIAPMMQPTRVTASQAWHFMRISRR